MRDEANKNDLFAFLAKETGKCKVPGKYIVSTHHQNIVCSSEGVFLGDLEPCTHEEADTRLLLHAADCVKQGHTKVVIQTADTDVAVLAISISQQVGAEELWLVFGTGKSFRRIPVHEIASTLGKEKCRALPIFHSVTGCDTVSFFNGKGKLSAWEAWMAFPQVTSAFLVLADCKEEVSTSTFESIERFIVLMYQRNSLCTFSSLGLPFIRSKAQSVSKHNKKYPKRGFKTRTRLW